MRAAHTEQDARAVQDGTPTRPGAMVIFYFREISGPGGRYSRSYDVLNSFNGTQLELNAFLGRSPALTFAIFDPSTTPWTLTYRCAVRDFSFHDAREVHPDLFPQFYIALDGSIVDADSYSKAPVMRGPNFREQ